MRKFFEIGGLVAAAVLVVFGAVAIAMGDNGRSTVNKRLTNEYIVGSSDMTPSGIKAEAQKAGITSAVRSLSGRRRVSRTRGSTPAPRRA